MTDRRISVNWKKWNEIDEAEQDAEWERVNAENSQQKLALKEARAVIAAWDEVDFMDDRLPCAIQQLREALESLKTPLKAPATSSGSEDQKT
jgi:hypothetical protein